MGYLVLVMLGLGFIVATWHGADTLPIWACYDTLLLVCHLQLLNINIPGPTVIFMTTLTKILSFEFVPVEAYFVEWLKE